MNKEFNRILIIRTDRIGDVLLSTPAIKAVRDSYPKSYIAMMIRPYARDIIEGNPYVNEVIIYDKYKKHRGWLSSAKFAFSLRKKKFDLAIILHPTNRVNIITFFANIPERVGFNRKCGFLLTKKLYDTKYLGQKHELEYTLDVVRSLNIEPEDKELFMPIKKESEYYIDGLFKKANINNKDKIVVIHPGASCPSKRWPYDRFAKLADNLIEKYRVKIVITAAKGDEEITKRVIANMKYPAFDFTGKTTISQLASLLKRSTVFISNDSGPVHIASAVGVAVISIFGRNQAGLSPLRWRPVGKHDKYLHKEIGCDVCLAHNCKIDFMCLKAISVEEVLSEVDEFLNL